MICIFLPSLWWKEQVVLTFHACHVFEPPLLPFVCSSSHQSPVLFHPCRFCSCLQPPPAHSDTTLSTVFGALVLLSAFSSRRLPRGWSHLASLFPSSSSVTLSFFFCLFLFLFLLLLRSLSLSPVVDWVSECLWQLCVVCNRAERLVWIQRWENLFMWEMHRWRQVSRRCGLFLAVILHSGPDRRSKMAKYARRVNQIPKLLATIQSMCVGVYVHLTEWVCVRAHAHAFDASPGSLDQTPLPRSMARVHYHWAKK